MSLGNEPYDLGNDPGSGDAEAGEPVNDWSLTVGGVFGNLNPESSVVYAGSSDYLHVPVSATDNDTGLPVDLTTQAVSLAFTGGADPASGDYKTGDWLTQTVNGFSFVYARIALADAGLTTGLYSAWVNAGGQIRRASGVLTII